MSEIIKGTLGFKGETGDSAYEIAVKNGYEGTEEEWVNSFINAKNYYNKDEINDMNNKEASTRQKIDSDLQAKINNLASGSPLVASSIEEMTDTSRVYVNTTDGNWYYYDGTSWLSGGTYQGRGISENSITPEMTTFYESINLIPDKWEEGYYIENTNNLVSDERYRYTPDYIPVTPGDILYKIGSNIKSIRISLYDSEKNILNNYNFNGQKIGINNNAHYIRFSISEEFDFIIIGKSQLKNSINYNKIKYLKDDYFNNIKSSNVINDSHDLKLLPESKTNNIIYYNDYNSGYYEYTTTSEKTGIVEGILCSVNNIQVGDTLFLDMKDTTLNYCEGKTFGMYTNGISTKLGVFEFVEGTLYKYTFTQENIDTLISYNNEFMITTYLSNVPTDAYIKINYTIFFENEYGTVERSLKNLFKRINNLENTENVKSYKGMFLGDSITALGIQDRGWIKYFNKIIPMSSIINVAVSGAKLKDTSANQVYDGNPEYFPNNPENVLGNQVQKIINNNYEAPDFILIAIGTNGGIKVTSEDDIYNVYYNSDRALIPLENVDRTTDAGAFRYCQETLHNLYPNAIIVWCTPIQTVENEKKSVKDIIEWGNNLKQFTAFAGCEVIDTERCGINGVNEISQENGEYLIDGLHPNINGAKAMGYYNACEFKKYLDKINQLKSN